MKIYFRAAMLFVAGCSLGWLSAHLGADVTTPHYWLITLPACAILGKFWNWE